MSAVSGSPGFTDRLYRVVLRLYPRSFRERFGEEMAEFFHAQWRIAGTRGWRARGAFWRRAVADLAGSVWRERGLARAMLFGPQMLFTGASANIRDAFHFVRRSPGLSLAVTLLMAITIGAATSVFSVVNAALIRPLPFGDPGRIVIVWETRPEDHIARNVVSGHEFPVWQERNRVFERMAAVVYSGATLTGAGDPVALQGVRVTSGFFGVMGVQPAIGRAFRVDEDAPGRGQVVILSHRIWRERFGASPEILGRAVQLNDRPFQVVGVMPEGFTFPPGPPAVQSDFWSPIAEPIRLYRGRHYLYVLARLKPEVTLDQARVDMARVAESLRADFPELNRGHDATVVGLQTDLAAGLRPSLLLLFGAVACLLFIGCSNVAGLLLARNLARSREIGVRLALGAGLLGIARQLLAESSALASAGAALGVAGAVALVAAMPRLVPREVLPIDGVSIDITVLIFALAATVLTGVLFGLAPVFQTRRIDPATVLKQGQRTFVSIGHSRLRRALVIGQIALTLVLVLAAGLMMRALIALEHVRPGYTTEGILAIDLALPGPRYPGAVQQRAFFNDLVARTAAIPGVLAAAATSAVPIAGGHSGIAIAIEGRLDPVPGQDEAARYRIVSADYFRTMGIPVMRGRTFRASDARLAVPLIRWFPQQPRPDGYDQPQPPPVAVVNQAMARRFWPDENPIGSRIRVLLSPWIEIVGVVADTYNESLQEHPTPEIYLHDLQEPQDRMSVLVRSANDPITLGPAIRSTISTLDKSLAIGSMRTMEDIVEESFGLPRLTSRLLGTFAAIALGLMAAGIYGLMALTTRLRLPEIGVHLALGADRPQISRMVMRQGLTLTAIGMLIGIVLSVWLARLIGREFLGVEPIDPQIWIAAGIVLLGSTALACWWPAHRASRVDPTIVLRTN